MAQNKDFRTQTATPSTPSAGVVTYYVNNSGILNLVNANGTTYQANQLWSSSVATLNQRVIGGMVTTGTLTGSVGWLPVVGPSGESWAIPAFVRI